MIISVYKIIKKIGEAPLSFGDKCGLCFITRDCFEGVALGKQIEAHYEKPAHDSEGFHI